MGERTRGGGGGRVEGIREEEGGEGATPARDPHVGRPTARPPVEAPGFAGASPSTHIVFH